MERPLQIRVLWPEGVKFRVRIKVKREPVSGLRDGWPPFALQAGNPLFRVIF